MRKLLVLLALALGGVSASAASAPASIRVVLDDNYPPYIFRDAHGHAQGILKELWDLWQLRTGIAVDFQPMDWAKALAMLEGGKADVIDTIFETDERKKLYEFSAPYANIEVPLFFHRSISGIADAASAKGFPIGVKEGDACIEYLVRQGISDFRYYPSYEAEIEAAARQEIRVLCIDKPPAAYLLNRTGFADQLRYSPPLYVGQLHWAVAKGRADLRQVVAAGFAKISPEERQAIESRWLGTPLTDDFWERYRHPVVYGATALGLVLAMLFAWSWTLRRQVASRTAALTATLHSLQESKESFRTLFDQASDAIFILRAGTVLDCNRGAEIMFRSSSRAEMIGTQPLAAALPGQAGNQPSGPAAHDMLSKIRPGSPTMFEWRTLLPDGSPIEVEASLCRIDYAGEECILAIVRDITERKQQDSRIRELLDEQRLIFDNTYAGIMLLQNRRILKCNQHLADMFGFASPAELIGGTTERFYCSPEQFESVGRAGYAQLAEEGILSFEVEMCRRDGTPFWVMQTGRSLDPEAVLETPSIWVYTDISERKRAELALRQSRKLFSIAFDACPIAAGIVSTEDGRFIEANVNYERDFGWAKADMIGRTSLEIGLWPKPEMRDAYVERLARTGQFADYETVFVHRNGTLRNVSISASIIDLDGMSCIFAFITDITVRKQADADLRIAAAAFESQESTIVTDANRVILRANRAFSQTTGYTTEEVVGKTPSFFKSGRHDAEFYRQMWESIHRTGFWQGEVWDRRKNGDVYPKWLSISAVKDEAGTVTHYVGTHFDITERKRAEERIESLAYFDQLTGLANRFSLEERLKQAVALGARNGQQFALLLLDLDNFKTINDSLGHQVGDRLLMHVATCLTHAVRQSDVVARFGGDEFVIILLDIHTPADAAHIAGKILSALSEPCWTNGQELRTSTSIGICLYPDDATEGPDLLKKADVAMYHAKSKGRSNYQFFRKEIQEAATQRLSIEADLRKGLARAEFVLHYQPQLDLETGTLTGVEALVRWQHPERGMIPPADFLPIAEETGLIMPLGDWVLKEACRQLAQWRGRGLENLKMSVNLSAAQFSDPHLAARIKEMLEETGVPPDCLGLEITESMTMRAPDEAVAMMHLLTGNKLSLAIDDFGTGYSSLSYLKLFPISTLKIDRSFVKDIEVDQHDADICDVTVLLAHKLGMDVIAEGVESKAQFKYLLSIGCNKIQGYLVSKPLAGDQAEDFIRNWSRLTELGTTDLWMDPRSD